MICTFPHTEGYACFHSNSLLHEPNMPSSVKSVVVCAGKQVERGVMSRMNVLLYNYAAKVAAKGIIQTIITTNTAHDDLFFDIASIRSFDHHYTHG